MIASTFGLIASDYEKLTAQAKRDERSLNAYVCWLFAHGKTKPAPNTYPPFFTNSVFVRMPNDTHAAAKARAAKHGVTLSQLLRCLINGTE